MIFNKNSIEAILADRKCQTRRLVKKGDCADYQLTPDIIRIGKKDYTKEPDEYEDEPFRTKWQVGRSYAVQAGRGKPGLWYCPKCKEVGYKDLDIGEYRSGGNKECVANEWQPLRITITGIHKERLRDITEEDAEREGIEAFYVINPKDGKRWTGPNFRTEFSTTAKLRFMQLFYKLHKKKPLPRACGTCPKIFYYDNWNPEVWVLSFTLTEVSK